MNAFLFSHIADIDGITPIILSKLAFKNVTYKLLDNPIDSEFLTVVNNTDFSNYDYIFMTDLCISEDTLSKLDSNFLKKFKIFDHHIGNVNMNKYDFITIIDSKECGTSLYYNYLCSNFNNDYLSKDITKHIVEHVRRCDTWDFSLGYDSTLVDIFNVLGRDYYIDYLYNMILNSTEFKIDDKLKFLFEVEEKRKNEYIKEKEKSMIKCNINNYKVGVVFAEEYRSLLGNTLSKNHKELDFIIIININRSVSYRTVKDINLSDFASIYGGKGHPKAAGSPLPDNLKENIINLIFKEATYEK